MRAGALLLTALALVALPALATAPERSLRPEARAGAAPAAVQVTPRAAPAAPVVTAASSTAPESAARPLGRPDGILHRNDTGRSDLQRNAVCGQVALQGEVVGPVPHATNGCGIPQAVRITSVAGVRLSTPALMDCPTALALQSWVEQGIKPTFRRRGPVVEMRVAAHYVCRTRNHQRGARISEHGKGKAIDISSFTMQDGEVITVLDGWRRGQTRRLLHQVWRSACGPFGTVLGPNSDRHHRDHFHVDTAQYRSGPYCR